MASVTLLLAQYLPPGKDEPDVRHIVSVFKLIQDLLAPDPRSRGRNGFQALMSLLPDDHKARMLAASACTHRIRLWPLSCLRYCPD